jgi:AmmeMemoRadiSam system protein A
LEEKCGAFVTIETDSQLRGCIGNIESDEPLHKTVGEMAIASAFRDPRFLPLSSEEFEKLQIEISVLSPLARMDNKDKLLVGEHGILIKKGYNSGLLLPQVASRYGWGNEEFLAQTCLKANLPEDSWKEDDCEIWIFRAVIFGEGEYDSC